MSQKKIAIKITYGYGAMDFVVVNNVVDVQRAMYAKAEKIPVTIGGRFISGQEIKTIEPDFHSYTGWFRSYLPTSGEDFAQIERDVPKVIDEFIQIAAERVAQFQASGEVHRIGEQVNPATLLKSKN